MTHIPDFGVGAARVTCSFTWDCICYSACVYAMAIPSVCPSVCHTGGSVKNGWS